MKDRHSGGIFIAKDMPAYLMIGLPYDQAVRLKKWRQV